MVTTTYIVQAGDTLARIAKAHDTTWQDLAKLNGIGLIQLVEPNGNFSEKAGWLAGKFCKDADNDIIPLKYRPARLLLPIVDRNSPQGNYPNDYVPLPKE